jgi:hypothetical protein
METQIKEALTETLNALDRLLGLFRVERMLHLIIGVVGFILLVYAIVLLLNNKEVNTTLLVALFGSSGLITVSSARITYFFNKAFKLVEDIIHSLITGGKK